MRPDLDLVSTITRTRLVGVVRSTSPFDVVEACRALYVGGVRCVEITLTSPGAIAAIGRVRADLPAGCTIGAGTVLDLAMAEAALGAGAQFLVSPVVDTHTIEFARKRSTPILAGALTPTEMHLAWKAGASLVKLFPATHLTPDYLHEVLGPLPELRVCPMGGVTLENHAAWLKAGAAAVGVSSGLLPRELTEHGRWHEITELAQLWAGLCALPTATPAVPDPGRA
jgi:2-dehydro-3-deoxyphosphogluconate aldolase/(4S)-4-hydroxy-2-oxoglutarate aldolase